MSVKNVMLGVLAVLVIAEAVIIGWMWMKDTKKQEVAVNIPLIKAPVVTIAPTLSPSPDPLQSSSNDSNPFDPGSSYQNPFETGTVGNPFKQ